MSVSTGGGCRQLGLLRAQIFPFSLTQSELDHDKVNEPRSHLTRFHKLRYSSFMIRDTTRLDEIAEHCRVPATNSPPKMSPLLQAIAFTINRFDANLLGKQVEYQKEGSTDFVQNSIFPKIDII